MRVFEQAFVRGVRRVLQHWSLVLPLYAAGLGLGLIQSWPVWRAAENGALHTTALADLTRTSWNGLLNLVLGGDIAQISAAAGLWIAGSLGLAAVFGVVYNLFAGGILSVYAGTRHFWAGCRHLFWAFTGLGLLLVGLMLVAIVVSVLAALVGGAIVGVIVALVLLQLVNVVGEYARAIAVTHERRNPFVLLGLAFVFCARKLPGVLGFVVLAVLLAAAIAAVYAAAASALGGNIATIIVQQLVVFLGVGLKLLRLAWALSYVEAAPPLNHATGVANGPVNPSLPQQRN